MASLQLFHNPNSPYVRKVVIAARELGLMQRLDLHQLSPGQHAEEIGHLNALAQVPTLVTPLGPLFGSSVIVQYLDSLSTDPAIKVLAPASDVKRYEALTYEALCDGVLDAAMAIHYELILRTKEQAHPDLLDDYLGKIRRAVLQFANKLPLPDTSAKVLSHQGITLACVCWYLMRRMPYVQWKELEGSDKLSAWYAGVCKRDSWNAEKQG